MSETWNARQMGGDGSCRGDSHPHLLAKAILIVFVVLIVAFVVALGVVCSGECFGTGAGAF